MRRSRPRWILPAVSCALVATAGVLWILNRVDIGTLASSSYVQDALLGVTFSVVGSLIVARQPGNLVGWLFSLGGLGSGLTAFCSSYAAFALRTHPGLPGGELAAWGDSMLWVPSLGMVVFLLLLFPDGRPPTRRWRPVAFVALAGLVLVELGIALHPHQLEPVQNVHLPNPLGIEALRVPLEAAVVVGAVLLLTTLVASFVALVVRFRRSSGRERLQLKWFTYAGALNTVFTVATIKVDGGFWFALLQGVLVGPVLAVAVGAAMLRHNLYEIDVVINRTLVYALLTATLGAVYVGSVLLLQLVLDSVASDSSLAVAVSTLAVAALFRPARARIQAVVDRRFYRRKYDAARTLQEFSSRLREQVDLDALGGELRGVVTETMQPAHVSLWLREVGP